MKKYYKIPHEGVFFYEDEVLYQKTHGAEVEVTGQYFEHIKPQLTEDRVIDERRALELLGLIEEERMPVPIDEDSEFFLTPEGVFRRNPNDREVFQILCENKMAYQEKVSPGLFDELPQMGRRLRSRQEAIDHVLNK